MKYTIKDYVGRINVKSLVTRQRGGWRWQDAYAVNTYSARIAADGRALFYSFRKGAKQSMPQIKAYGAKWDHRGTLHNKPVPRSVAVAQLGAQRVAYLERRGVQFA